VLVSHDLNMAAEICDRLLLLDCGAAVDVGAPKVVLTKATLEAVYGCRIAVGTHSATGHPTVQLIWPS
jgi:iron complex transport system ATP-binding protein